MQEPVLMAHQPIFDNEVGVVAYELLFRQSENNEARVTDGDSATSELLINAFTHFNIDDVVGSKRCLRQLHAQIAGRADPLRQASLRHRGTSKTW